MAARRWTLEQRAKQSAAIQRWQPWASTTGPKTVDGKAKVSQNAYRGAPRVAVRAARGLAQVLADDAVWLKLV